MLTGCQKPAELGRQSDLLVTATASRHNKNQLRVKEKFYFSKTSLRPEWNPNCPED
jgi:hypothetical protein